MRASVERTRLAAARSVDRAVELIASACRASACRAAGTVHSSMPRAPSAAIEVDRRRVPVQHATIRSGRSRARTAMLRQRRPSARRPRPVPRYAGRTNRSSRYRPRLAEEGRIVVEEQREAGRHAIDLGDHHFGRRAFAPNSDVARRSSAVGHGLHAAVARTRPARAINGRHQRASLRCGEAQRRRRAAPSAMMARAIGSAGQLLLDQLATPGPCRPGRRAPA